MVTMRRALSVLLAALLWAGAAAAQMEGRFRGIDAAEGMTLELTKRGQGWRGVLTEADGTARRFEADALDAGAEASITLSEGPAILRLTPQPAGVGVIVAPVGGEVFDPSRARALAFLRAGLEPPPPPRRYVPPPARPGAPVEARAFVESYPFWEPLGAAWGYEGVDPKMRTVIRLFALVQTDLLWKLCRSPERTAGLAEALRGQGVTCQEVLQAMGRAMESGRVNAFVRDVAAERRTLLTVLGCAYDLRRTDPACRQASAVTAERAVSMETAATVLRRYR